MTVVQKPIWLALCLIACLLSVSPTSAAIFTSGSSDPGISIMTADLSIAGSSGSSLSQMSHTNIVLDYLTASPGNGGVPPGEGGGGEGGSGALAGGHVDMTTYMYGGTSSPTRVFGSFHHWGTSSGGQDGGSDFGSSSHLSSGTDEGQYWRVTVLPEAGEILGTPTDITIDAALSGSSVATGSGVARAQWWFATSFGDLLSGSAQPGNFGESEIQHFTIPLGSTFEMYFYTSASVSGSDDATADLQASFEMYFTADVRGGAVPEPATICVWTLLGAVGAASCACRRMRKG
jgi:hypothetical protein